MESASTMSAKRVYVDCSKSEVDGRGRGDERVAVVVVLHNNSNS